MVSYLLQIRHGLICSSFTSNKLLKGFDSVFKRICNTHGLGEYHNQDSIQQLRPIVESMYEEVVNNSTPNLDKEFWAEYSEALKALRKEKPFIAFQLLDWENELAYLKMRENYANQFTSAQEIQKVDIVRQLIE